MKIYTKVVLQWQPNGTLQRLDDACESFEYAGPVALCGGGGNSGQKDLRTGTQKAGQDQMLQQANQLALGSSPQYAQPNYAGLFGAGGNNWAGGKPDDTGKGGGAGYVPGLAGLLQGNQPPKMYAMGTPGGGAPTTASGLAPMTAPVNAMQDAAYAAMQQNAQNIPGQIQQSWAPAQAAMGYMLDPNNLRMESNPYTQSYMDAATRGLTRDFTQNVLPNIRGDAVSSGMYGGSRQGVAEGAAAGNYMTSLGDTYSQIANDAYGKQLGAMVAGSQMAPTYATTDLMLNDAQAQYMANAGEYKRGLDNIAIQDPWNRLSWLSSFYPGAGTAQNQGPPQPYKSPWASAAGGAAVGTSIMPGWGTAIGAGLGYILG